MDVPAKKKAEGAEVERAADRPRFLPNVNIYESESAVTLLADLPGVAKDAVSLVVEDGVLTLSGNVRSGFGEEADLQYCESEDGDFFRSFQLGRDVDGSKMDASMEDGVLKLVIPKSDWAKTKKIEVK